MEMPHDTHKHYNFTLTDQLIELWSQNNKEPYMIYKQHFTKFAYHF